MKKGKKLTFSLISVILSTLIYPFFAKNQALLTIIYASIMLIDYLIFKDKHALIIFFIGGITGPLAEIVGILSGAWTYTNPNLILIPSWLPIAWGIWAVFIKRVSEKIKI